MMLEGYKGCSIGCHLDPLGHFLGEQRVEGWVDDDNDQPVPFQWHGFFVPEIIREKEIENGLRQAEKTPKTKE
jgi:hypothetical protein